MLEIFNVHTDVSACGEHEMGLHENSKRIAPRITQRKYPLVHQGVEPVSARAGPALNQLNYTPHHTQV